MTEPDQRLGRSNTTGSGSRVWHQTRHSIGGYAAAGVQSQATDETLYSHPSVKIIKFEPPKSAAARSTGTGTGTSLQSSLSSSTLPDLDYPVDAVETLPWRVSTERIAALGPLRLEDMASTRFLKAGTVIQPLLKNCQGWCVDGQSIFVLRIRRLTYYRIELPYETEEDKRRADSFKDVLSKIIRYEVTPCPFQRGFSVEIPEEAKTPRKKKAWTPKHSPSVRVNQAGAASGGHDDDDPDAGERETMSDSGSADDDRPDDGPSKAADTSRSRASTCIAQVPGLPTSDRVGSTARSVTEPPRSFDSLVSQFQNASGPVLEVDHGEPPNVDSIRPSSERVPSPPQSPPSPTPSSRPKRHYTAEDLHIPPFRGHHRDLSDATVTSLQTDAAEGIPSAPDTPEPPSQQTNGGISPPTTPERSCQTGPSETPNSTLRQRRKLPGELDLSPPSSGPTLPNPAPRPPTPTITGAILREAFSFVLEAPVHLVLLVVRYAVRIAAAEPKGEHTGTRDDDRDERDEMSSEDGFGTGRLRESPRDPRPPGAWDEL